MSEQESFVEEVNEELRRDRLYGHFKRYGWIAITLVVLAVGGAAYNEWRKASAEASSQALGDAVTDALQADDAAARAIAVAAVETDSANSAAYIEMLEAAELAVAEDYPAALAIFDSIAADTEAPLTYRSLASLKAVMMRGADMDRDARIAVLDQLATPGNPFRAIAMEQKAIALVDYEENDDAIALLLALLDEPQATGALRSRAQQLIVALGGELPVARQ